MEDYELGRAVGNGAFATCYLARRKQDGMTSLVCDANPVGANRHPAVLLLYSEVSRELRLLQAFGTC